MPPCQGTGGGYSGPEKCTEACPLLPQNIRMVAVNMVHFHFIKLNVFMFAFKMISLVAPLKNLASMLIHQEEIKIY